MLKVSAAVLIAAMSALPALAAVNATVVMGTKADIVPVTALDSMIGKWTPADLTALDKAGSVIVFDSKKLYASADLTMIGKADTAAASELTRMRAALSGDAALKAWFAHNKIDINSVIAISDANGKVEVYTF